MGSFSFRSALRRLEKLERDVRANNADIDTVFFTTEGGGAWGHRHIISHSKGQPTEYVPCSVEEEIQLMRASYEDYNHRFGRGEELSFPDWLECLDYLGPPSLAEQRKAAIQQLRKEDNEVR